MVAMQNDILGLVHYDFFRNAMLAALLSSIVCGVIGSYIVSRRLVFISGGITHSSFGGIGLAYFMGFNPILGALIFSLLSAFGIEYLSKRSDLREDSAIGMIWTVGMAIGIIFIAITPGYSPNLMSYLFGSILTVASYDLLAMSILAIFVILIFVFFYRTILYVSFDDEYARTRKLPVDLVNYLMLGLISLTIVLNIRIVGVILLISFLTIPQVTANILTREFKGMIVLSVLFALLGSVIGLLVSYRFNIPSGPAIICIFVLIFLLTKLFKRFSVVLRLNKKMNNLSS
jgi:zinc transport system permease protein